MTQPDKTRGARLKQAAKIGADDIGRRLIVTIGIDNYQHMPKLHNAVGDARGIHQYFTESLGFEAPLLPLLDTKATKRAIKLGSFSTLAAGGMVGAYFLGRIHGRGTRRFPLFR